MTTVTLTTANTPGAVAILHLHGEGVTEVLSQLTKRVDWPTRRALLVDFAGVDEGLAIRINDHVAQLMPHGGPRVVQRLIDHLTGELGCAYDPTPDTRALYPEAATQIEADMLHAIARAASPAAIDLLANQPAQWRSLVQQTGQLTDPQLQHITERSRTLDRLIAPPTVVVVGPPNVGKSTLTNALMGQAVSIVADLPGTTRDWVGALVELGVGDWDLGKDSQGNDTELPNSQPLTPNSHIAVHWLDTPGLHDSDDAIEQRAIQLAKKQIQRADVLIAMRDLDHPWPDPATLPREPDLWLVNKADNADAPDEGEGEGETSGNPLHLSAAKGINLDALQRAAVKQLGLDELAHEPWAFSENLSAWCESGEHRVLEKYLGAAS